MTSWCYG